MLFNLNDPATNYTVRKIECFMLLQMMFLATYKTINQAELCIVKRVLTEYIILNTHTICTAAVQ